MVWRSWFWNIVLAILLAILASMGVITTVVESTPVGKAVFAVVTAVTWIGAVRALFLGVRVRPDAIVMRGLMRTYTMRWGEIESIGGDMPAGGPSGSLGATAPVVRRKGKKDVELNVLGGYGFSPIRPTPAERAVAELNVRLARWKAEHPA
ncbi:hypothetical protein R8Z50_26870 [Longispora sp. K20-0274]|uniref:hypothetical protein n=1 Tax=Longispora sp. K20-0274 TaxID=3088255 RepID=UPI00399AE57F